MTSQEELTQEAKRVARGMWKALGSAHVPPELVGNPEIDVSELFREIGRELFECANPIDDYDRAPAAPIFEDMIDGLIEASNVWDAQHMGDDYDEETAQERRNAIKTLLRLATVDGKPVSS